MKKSTTFHYNSLIKGGYVFLPCYIYGLRYWNFSKGKDMRLLWIPGSKSYEATWPELLCRVMCPVLLEVALAVFVPLLFKRNGEISIVVDMLVKKMFRSFALTFLLNSMTLEKLFRCKLGNQKQSMIQKD